MKDFILKNKKIVCIGLVEEELPQAHKLIQIIIATTIKHENLFKTIYPQ